MCCGRFGKVLKRGNIRSIILMWIIVLNNFIINHGEHREKLHNVSVIYTKEQHLMII